MNDQTISNALRDAGAYRAIRSGSCQKLDQAFESAFFHLFGFDPNNLGNEKEDKPHEKHPRQEKGRTVLEEP